MVEPTVMESSTSPQTANSKLILYFADGFAFQYFSERPFLDEFWTARGPLETLLGYSSTIMPCILTGQLPSATGMWTEYYLAPGRRSILQRLLSRPRLRWASQPADLARLVYFRFARKLGMGMEHRLRIPLALSHLFARHPLQYDQFPPIGLPVRTLADVFRDRGLTVDFRYVRDGLQVEAELAHLAETADSTDVYFYYDPTMDSKGHKVGASASDEALGPTMDRIGSFLRDAWTMISEEYPADLLLFSDHGMTTVSGAWDLLLALEDFRLGVDYLAFVDSTMARFWFPNGAMRSRIMARLEGAPARFLTSEERSGLGITFDDDRYGQEILVADEGIVLHPNYFAGPFTSLARSRKYPEAAMHGYLPEAPSSVGVFCYRGNRFEDDEPVLLPGVVTEIFEFIVRILDAPDMSHGGQ